MILIGLLWAGCDSGPGGRVVTEPLEDWIGKGYAIRVPAHATVRPELERLRVDAADGSRWFDIAWVTTDDPQVVVNQWVNVSCEGMRWDKPAILSDHQTSTGGLCTMGRKDYWAIASVESFGSKTLVTCYRADTDRLTLEDAWIDFSRTALSLKAGTQPRPSSTVPDMQKRVREVGTDRQLSGIAVPGGGILSAQISSALATEWQTRPESDFPAEFSP